VLDPEKVSFGPVASGFLPENHLWIWVIRGFPRNFHLLIIFSLEIVWKPSVILLLCLSMETLGSPFLTFFSIYNSNDKLEQRHLVFVFNKNHNANPHLQWEKLFPELRDRPSSLGKGPSPKKRSILGAKTPRKCTKFFSRLPNIYKIYILQKNGPNRPILSSAVIRIIYCRL